MNDLISQLISQRTITYQRTGEIIAFISQLTEGIYKVIKAFSGKVEPIVQSKSMDEAVKAAYYLARDGETVLLSPACASFDLFDSFEDRGRQFKEAVRSL